MLERFPGYWNAAAIDLDRIEFRIAVDATVRRVNLQSGGFDVVGRLAPTDVPAVQADRRLRVIASPSLGYQIISFNLARGEKSQTPFARDRRVREAFEKSIDREALNQVVYEGRYVPSNQTEAPGSRYYDASHPLPKRDLAGARALLREAGLSRVQFGLIVGNDPVTAQVGQVIQAMAAEAGIEVQLTQMESATMVAATKAGGLSGGDGDMERPAGPGWKSQHLGRLQGLSELGRLLQPGAGQAAERGGADGRTRGAGGAVRAGRKPMAGGPADYGVCTISHGCGARDPG